MQWEFSICLCSEVFGSNLSKVFVYKLPQVWNLTWTMSHMVHMCRYKSTLTPGKCRDCWKVCLSVACVLYLLLLLECQVLYCISTWMVYTPVLHVLVEYTFRCWCTIVKHVWQVFGNIYRCTFHCRHVNQS